MKRALGNISMPRVDVLLLVLVFTGSFFRLHALGVAPLRADTMEFWRICRTVGSASEIFTRWLELLGISGALPFPLAATYFVIDALRLDMTFFSIRLPSALWGIVTIAAAYGVGRFHAGRKMGLLMAAFFAVSPAMIQWNREAYFYSPLLLGSFFLLWTLLYAQRVFSGRVSLRPGFYFLLSAGMFLMTWSLPTTWLFVGAALLYIIGGMGWTAWRRPEACGWSSVFKAMGCCLVIGLPLLFSRWGVSHMMQYAENRMMGAEEWPLAAPLSLFVTVNAWGRTLPGLVLLGVVMAVSVYHALRPGADRKEAVLLYGGLLAGTGFVLISCMASGQPFQQRYLLHLTPWLMLMLCHGLFHLDRLIAVYAKRKTTVACTGLIPVLALGFLVPFAWHSVKMNGNPTPYGKMNRWVREHRSLAHPVLVDRWLEPWNELAVHDPDIKYTFLFPDEPVDAFLKNDWRGQVKSFFERFPDATYMEITKNHWEDPRVGPWEWPRSYFARHTAITNESGLLLRKVGLAARDDFYAAHTNRLVVDIFYNEREDLVKRSHGERQQPLRFYGPGWTYIKPWRETGTFHDFYVMGDRGVMDLYNPRTHAITVALNLTALAAGAPKEVRFRTQVETFNPNQFQRWLVGDVSLDPGWNRVAFHSTAEYAAVPLLVTNVELHVGHEQ